MDSFQDLDAEQQDQKNVSINEFKDTSVFHGIILSDNNKYRPNYAFKDEIPFLTPKKNKDHLSRISLTPISMVKNIRDTSPFSGFKKDRHLETTIRHKENFQSMIFSEKPKNRSPIFASLFQQTGEKTSPINQKPETLLDLRPLKKPSDYYQQTLLFGDIDPRNQHQLNKYQNKKNGQNQPDSKKEYFTQGCNCRNSQCLKLYCECLRKGDYCKNCNCQGCENFQGSYKREKKVQNILKKNPNAFKPIIQQNNKGSEKTHFKGCNCKKSNCLKNYCECHQFGVSCAEYCRCLDCKNTKQHVQEKNQKNNKKTIKEQLVYFKFYQLQFMKFFLILFTISTISSNDFFNVFMEPKNVNQFLKTGSLRGYFYENEFWQFYENLRNDPLNQKFLSEKFSIGKTYENREMHGIYISEDIADIDIELRQKNIILITALHHSREPLTLTMIMLILIENLKAIREDKHNKMHEFFRDNIFFLVPILNLDSYLYIQHYWQDPEMGEEIMMIRKNRNLSSQCTEITGGVDLNRNYDYKFALDEEGSSSDPCSEDYRGSRPFSERETYNLKKYVDHHPNIVSAINIHSYGNAWIYPFNYVHDPNDRMLKHHNELFYKFLQDFQYEMKKKDHKAIFGNAAFTLDYASNGEAGDWFTGAKKILNLDVELGDANEESNKFYPPKVLIDKIVRYNYVIMKEFFKKHIIDFGLKKLTYFPNHDEIKFEIQNLALSGLQDFQAKLTPIFQPHYIQQGGYQIKYAVKRLLRQTVGNALVIANKITTTLKGRHVMEVRFIFNHKSDYEKFAGFEMEIIRNEQNSREYPNQNFIFKTSQTRKE